jgi:hypothetical protein
VFRDELGYRFLGDRSDRLDNSNIDEPLLTAYLLKRNYTREQMSRAIYLLKTEAVNPNRNLYEKRRNTAHPNASRASRDGHVLNPQFFIRLACPP